MTLAPVLGLAISACASSPPAQTPAAPPAQTTREAEAAPRPLPTSTGLDTARVRAEALSILAELAETRQLALTREVHVDVIDRPGIRAFAKASMEEGVTPEQMLLLGKIEASLGILPPDADPEEVLLDLLEEGVLGFYDPKRRTLFIGDFVPRPVLSMVVGHEIAHGLQDMHFDLQAHQAPLLHRADAESARRFLIEGEAQAAYLAWVSGADGLRAIDEAVLNAMGDQTLDLGGVGRYPILARALQLPYADGTATVVRLVLAKGWSAIDALYKDMPTTTEQMLHIDKLLARETAVEMSLAPEPLSALLGLKPVWHDQVGEATLLAMLAEVEGAGVARRCAAGWDGDALLAFDDGDIAAGLPTVLFASTWEHENDARDFEACMQKYLHEVVGTPDTLLERRGKDVLVGTALPANVAVEAVAKTAWSGLRVGARTPSGGSP